jgi:3'-phosphoadenosine 5'-phosphosulfate sulfotransferase (PAPS reductase)/FAD synthetase
MKVLQFSGGIDSLATLFLKRPEWENIVVMWCNTGAAYPETLELMRKVHELVPHFKEVVSNKPRWEENNGIAVDTVPEHKTHLGHIINSTNGPVYASPFRCCAANIWAPMEAAAKELGATHIIRGQRSEEKRKAPIRSGHVDPNGITYEFPIEDWSKPRVFAYCEETCPHLIPDYYFMGEMTSHDCWDCIAYLAENQRRILNLPYERKVHIQKKLKDYMLAMSPEVNIVRGLICHS